MIKAVLLDLDDTLLRIGTDAFIAGYLAGLNTAVARTHPELSQGQFSKAMVHAVQAIMQNTDPTCTNAETYVDAMTGKVPLTPEALTQIFDEYQTNGYHALQSLVSRSETSPALIDHLGELGLTVVVATNPVFRFDVVRQRMAWGGLDSPRVPYALVTHIDDMHFSKPMPHYFEEILARIGVEADEAIMVGDSYSLDMIPAAKAGLNTFWIDWDNPLPDDAAESTIPDGHGTLEDFNRLVREGWLATLQPRPRTAAQLIPRLVGNVGALFALTAALKPEDWIMRPDAKEWSPLEIVCHLRDSERSVQRPRLQRIVNDDNPFVSQPATPPGPGERDLTGEDGSAAARQFWQERQETIRLIEGLRSEDWQRPARHSIFGPTTLLEMAHFTTRHDHLHLCQLCETLGRCKGDLAHKGR